MWIAFLSSMFFGMFLGPILIYFFGYKVSSISGNIGLLGYVFANFYPSKFKTIYQDYRYIQRIYFWDKFFVDATNV